MQLRLGQILSQEDLNPAKLNEILSDIERAFGFVQDTKEGDTVYLTSDNTIKGDNTHEGKIIMSGKAIDTAVHTETAHATTSDPWTGGNTCIYSGGSVTFTDIADAPQVGAVRIIIPQAGDVWTDGAVFDVNAGANYTCLAGDVLRLEAVTVSTFRLSTITRATSVSTATTSAEGVNEWATDAEVAADVPSASRVPTVASLRNGLIWESALTSVGTGTTIGLSGFPSWCKAIDVLMDSISANGTNILLMRVGDSGGLHDTGYAGSASLISSVVSTSTSVTALVIRIFTAASKATGVIQMRRFPGTERWTMSYVGSHQGAATQTAGTVVTLDSSMTQLGFLWTGSNIFDGGQFSVMAWG